MINSLLNVPLQLQLFPLITTSQRDIAFDATNNILCTPCPYRKALKINNYVDGIK